MQYCKNSKILVLSDWGRGGEQKCRWEKKLKFESWLPVTALIMAAQF